MYRVRLLALLLPKYLIFLIISTLGFYEILEGGKKKRRCRKKKRPKRREGKEMKE